MRTTGTYHVSQYENAGSVCITFFGSDADTARKGWRSIGCQSVPVAELQANLRAMERNGYTRETRSPAEMAAVAQAAA